MNEATTMVKLVGRRTGVVVDTDDLQQDGAFDDLDAFWSAAAQPARPPPITATLGGPPGLLLPGTTPRPAHAVHGCRAGAFPEWARRFLCLALSVVGATSPSPSQVRQTA